MTTTRRQFMTGAGVAAAAWVVPSILTAKPAEGALLLSSGPRSEVVPAVSQPPAKPLAFTGDDLERDAGIGAALVAGGWLLRHWTASDPLPNERTP